jgi:hypothetical protein
VLPSRWGTVYRSVVLNVYTLYREATPWWFHLVVDLGTNGRFTNVPMQLTWAKHLKTPKLSNTFEYIRKWFYLIVLVLLHWNKHRATFFGKYKILWGVSLPPRGYPWRSYDPAQPLICFFCRYIKNTL